ncbi:MAGUK p55 subfamily member 5-A [Trichonephila clavata]|uniref:MAGUK p55 subfamily member 5-A n=1 Tax=Trichonephila clavata TaxID=2740835 RepID=A0A8X6HAX6_TRICU|nr:MAGUK p55 subfamily member 5-A [Trichonephila clavata]
MIKRSIPHHQIIIHDNNFETTAIKIVRQNDQPITIVSAYRPPRKPITALDLHNIFRNQGYVLVAGDLNAKHRSWSPQTQQNRAGTIVRNFCDSTGYSLNAPAEPTYFHGSTRNTTIDLAICKGMTVIDSTSIPELSSDHNPVLFEVSLDNYTSPALSTFSFPNWTKFQEILSNTLPRNPKISNSNDIENAIKNFNSTFHNALSNSSTFKVINKPLNAIPSFIRDKNFLKKRLRKEWQDSKYPPFKTQLNKLQKEIKRDLNNFKNNKWNKILTEASPDDDSLYKVVKSITNRKPFHIPLVGPMGLHYSTEDKVNLFADSLESSFQSLKILKKSDLMPYVVFIAPPSLEKLRLNCLKLDMPVKDDELKDIIEKAREMEEFYGHYFDLVLINVDLEKTFSELLHEISVIEREPQWVPATWIKDDAT